MGDSETPPGSGSRASFRQRAEVQHGRRGLVKGTRHLVNLSILTHLGRMEDLRECFTWALDRRVKVSAIRETLLQTFLFSGYPRVLNAFEVLEEVLERRGVTEEPRRDRLPPRSSVAAFFRRRGRALFEEIYRDDTDLVVDRISGFHPEFMDWILEDAYGKVLGRPYLDVRTREILAVALLTALNLARQLTPHLRGALRAGVRPRELEEAIRQVGLVLPRSHVKMALVRLERARTTL